MPSQRYAGGATAMTITYHSAAAHIRHTLGGDLSSELDVLTVVNNAGHYMTSIYPWRWLEGSATLGALTSGTTTALPTGFVELLGYTPRGSDSRVTGSKAYLVSPTELEDMRNSSGTLPLDTAYIAVVYITTSGTSTIASTPALDVYGNGTLPTVKIRYRSNWTQITDDEDVFILPAWLEPLYIECLRAFARGYEEEDVATMNARLTDAQNSPLLASSIGRDSLIESPPLRAIQRPTPAGLAK